MQCALRLHSPGNQRLCAACESLANVCQMSATIFANYSFVVYETFKPRIMNIAFIQCTTLGDFKVVEMSREMIMTKLAAIEC